MSETAAPTHPHSGSLVRRYGRTQRAAHWWLAGMFFVTMVTAPEGARGDTPMLVIHILAASALLLGLAIVVVVGDRAALAADVRALMWFDATDRAWLRSLTQPRHGRQPARWGKFNAGQKAAAWVLLVLMIGVFVTGAGATITGGGGGHGGLLAATMLVLIGHIAMAVVNPMTRPALRGMILGAVHRTWAQRHHPAWLDEVNATEKPDAR